MESKFNISDIIRYMLIGLFFFFSLLCIYCTHIDMSPLEWGKDIFTSSSSFNGFSIMILLLLCFYLLGITIQGVSKMLTTSLYFVMRKKEKERSFLGKICNYLFFRITPESRCLELKRQERLDVPEWIKISKDPPRLMEYIKLNIEMKQPSLNMNEYFHFNELFQGIYVSSIILFFISAGIAGVDLYNYFSGDTSVSFYPFLKMTLLFVPSAILSYILSCIYASRGIMTLDIRKKALDIDISKSMQKIGIQQVHVLIRTHRIKPRAGRESQDLKHEDQLKYLNEAITSVGDQDYHHINILLLGDCYCANIDAMVKERLDKYGDKLSIQYCFEKESSVAESSRSIRNQILDIANSDDIIMFLNDDDFFYRKNAVSEIVYRMNSLNANLCLSAFNVNSQKDDNIVIKNGRLHNTLVRKLSRHDKAVTQKDKSLWHFASTISWTKIYRAGLLNELNNITKEINDSSLKDLVAFEDFMDYLVFLFDDIRVTAVGEPVYSYRKHDKGNVHKRDQASFEKLRIGYLHIVKEIVELVLHPNKNDKDYTERANRLFKDGASSCDRIKSSMVSGLEIKDVHKYLGLKIYEISDIIERFVAAGSLELKGIAKDSCKEWFVGLCKEQIGSEVGLFWEKNVEEIKGELSEGLLYFEDMESELESFEFD